VGGALNQNLLLPAYLTLGVFALVAWTIGEVRGTPSNRRLPAWSWALVAAVVVVFTVARNVPGVDFLPSGTG
jgi:hypothetical protein